VALLLPEDHVGDSHLFSDLIILKELVKSCFFVLLPRRKDLLDSVEVLLGQDLVNPVE